MRKHLALSRLTPEHFSRWLEVFAETALTVLPLEKAKPMIEMSERIGKSLQMGLAYHHEKTKQATRPFQAFSFKP